MPCAGRVNHAGIGVLIHDKTEGQKKTIIIFAATQATAALQAAAKALELAAWPAHLLQLKKTNFMLDNQNLDEADARRDLQNFPRHD